VGVGVLGNQSTVGLGKMAIVGSGSGVGVVPAIGAAQAASINKAKTNHKLLLCINQFY